MATNFLRDQREGAKSEGSVVTWLTRRGWDVTDVSRNITYRDKHVDLIAMQGADVRNIEVKRDNLIGATGNFFLETVTNAAAGRAGWFAKTQADYLWVHDTLNEQYYVCRIVDLRDYVRKYPAKYKHLEGYDGTNFKRCEAWIVPLHKFQQHFDLAVYDAV